MPLHNDESLLRRIGLATKSKPCAEKIGLLIHQNTAGVADFTRALIQPLLDNDPIALRNIFLPINASNGEGEVIGDITRSCAMHGHARTVYELVPNSVLRDVYVVLQQFCKSEWDAIQTAKAQAAQLAQQRAQQAAALRAQRLPGHGPIFVGPGIPSPAAQPSKTTPAPSPTPPQNPPPPLHGHLPKKKP
ncbi:hypothetical protein A3D88_00160 [Candidatus Peribacteria bacterium RIFCSPHIGHO2_02_FULL_52_16]|nr:MAG: hypothetical protein A2706_01140 [Candidatus Peribacteria bacterium RIFCSPHIGHO2_01_FULL_51_35]OGJ61537.1 MAG: hypothetical protein A3D88_00160 [Candidatus Peribacteria bacterium RIFCSPHIGHO2_02_FULL_52_16]